MIAAPLPVRSRIQSFCRHVSCVVSCVVSGTTALPSGLKFDIVSAAHVLPFALEMDQRAWESYPIVMLDSALW